MYACLMYMWYAVLCGVGAGFKRCGCDVMALGGASSVGSAMSCVCAGFFAASSVGLCTPEGILQDRLVRKGRGGAGDSCLWDPDQTGVCRERGETPNLWWS